MVTQRSSTIILFILVSVASALPIETQIANEIPDTLDGPVTELTASPGDSINAPATELTASPGDSINAPDTELTASPGDSINAPDTELTASPGDSINAPATELTASPGDSINALLTTSRADVEKYMSEAAREVEGWVDTLELQVTQLAGEAKEKGIGTLEELKTDLTGGLKGIIGSLTSLCEGII